MGIWEENRSRLQPPWNGRTITRGMEFGVSPMPETRRAMIERARLVRHAVLSIDTRRRFRLCRVLRRSCGAPREFPNPSIGRHDGAIWLNAPL